MGVKLLKSMLFLIAVFGGITAAPVAADDKDAVGTWSLTYSPGDGEHKATLTISKAGPSLKAEFKDGDRKYEVTKVEFKDGKLIFSAQTQRDGEKSTATFEGKIEGNSIKGDVNWEYQGMSGSFTFEGKREVEKPSDSPSVEAVSGKPNLLLGNFDLAQLGYQVDEFFVSGTATSYKLAGDDTADGNQNAVPAGTAPYTTRIVVLRPSDPAKFSGTAVVEWLNVSGGFDMPVDWNMTHREVVRRGHAYVCVSAQKAGLDAMKKADAGRYKRLSHPGDAYSFDIFSQAGKLLKESAASKVLAIPVPQRVLAIGESQSAFYLTTYTAAVDPVAKVYDGILVHSRFGTAAPLDNTSMFTAMIAAMAASPKGAELPSDLRVPVLTVIAESDLLGWPPLNGYHTARQPDSDRLRVWEIAGSAHADNYTFSVGFIDSGLLPIEKLAAAYAPTTQMFGGQKLAQPMNFGPQHHYVVQAALWQLGEWVKTGQAAPKAPPLKLTADKSPKLVTDANGLAVGGLRTPWVDVPTAVLSGAGGMVGFGKPFDAATLARLYPGGKNEYLKEFEASLDECIKNGFIVPDDKKEILQLAAISFDTQSKTSATPAAPNTSSAAAAPAALVDKAVRALGGAEKLGRVKAASWTAEGTFNYQGNEIPITHRIVAQGIDHFRREWEIDAGGTQIDGATVVAGDKAWSKFMGNVEELAKDKLANERRLAYLSMIPVTLLPLKGEKYKLEAVADERVGDRPAAGLKVTPSDGKEFRLYFDKESGLPVRMVAKVLDHEGVEFTEDTTFGDYKPADGGIQKSTKIETKRDGEKSGELRISDFKLLDKVDSTAFETPK